MVLHVSGAGPVVLVKFLHIVVRALLYVGHEIDTAQKRQDNKIIKRETRTGTAHNGTKRETGRGNRDGTGRTQTARIRITTEQNGIELNGIERNGSEP